ncbi:N-acetyllactosaminide beta-1,3-N-acetylglucosaminyltransferase 2a isoform X1 [Phyllopteryx taeniolatus]|uniref:N-acetyllactosaminide beta-1,3-N-acetylglucosaminyltransferase 2a isoform X1 n=2 Tax=Phyllopteryx taeniolatus TaxID=161469 RepID=UPI002AD2D47D|nr:N-acetyllactosaminide beta-1,3-N-acetylglucosaminyltransferase 2a isoform X1 [Phyllopteryx taeniolatus]
MFPNVPLFPGVGEAARSPPGGLLQTQAWTLRPRAFQLQLGINVAALVRRSWCLLCAMLLLNVLVCCILATLSWKLRQDQSGLLKLVSARSGNWSGPSFWNTEQRRLNLMGPRDSCEADRRVVAQQVWDYNALPRRLQDFLLYIHCRKSSVLQVPGPGGRPPDLFLLLVVKSLVPHFGRRQAIRQTWGRAGVLANRTVATVFLLGQMSPEDHYPDLRGMLGKEAALHRDLLQWEFRDTPLNSSLKETLFLQWFHRNCPWTRFVLEARDDSFINTFQVLDFLETLPRASSNFLFIGDVVDDGRPPRDRALLDFVPPSIFTGAYPPYAASGGFLLSGEVAVRLHNVSRRVLLFPVHDVYMGLCLRELGLVPQKHPGFATLLVRPDHDDDKERGEVVCVERSLMVVSGHTPQEILRMWSTAGGRLCQATATQEHAHALN